MSILSPLVDDSQCQLSNSSTSDVVKDSMTKQQGHKLKRTLLQSRTYQSAKMMNLIKSGLRLVRADPAGASSSGNSSFLALLLIVALASSIALHVRCQDFQDLKNNNLQRQAPNFGAPSNNFQPQAPQQQQFASQSAPQQPQAFQPSRQQQFPGVAAAAPNSAAIGPHIDLSAATVNSRSPFQRPVLSSRFSQQQQPQPQASQTSSAIGASGQQAAQTPSNIEAIMKGALARTAKLEGPESRQDSAPQAELASPSTRASSSSSSFQASQTPTSQRERQAEPSESTASTQPVDMDAAERQTTTQSSHETVYSDQRFANLFARRNAAKKSKLVPVEQPKAKPTLPSFIKSLPDPKQFTANPLEQVDRPISSSSSNLVSARLQQQLPQAGANQNRTPKKNSSVTGSSSPALTNGNKRGQVQRAPSAAKAMPNGSAKPGAAPGADAKPTANNPFSKSQANSSDPANVIAMARRRLLANNALQQKQQAN